jgi:tetratricopeptide (TPR) repeat protein
VLETIRARSLALHATEFALHARIALANLDRLEGRIEAAIAELGRVRDEATDPALRRVRILALDGLGVAYWDRDRIDLARASQEEQLRLAKESHDPGQEFLACVRLGTTTSRSGEFESAYELLAHAVDVAKEGDVAGRGCEAWLALGWHAEEQGRFREAVFDYRRALELEPEPIVKVDVLGSLGNALFAMHESGESRTRFQESQDLARRMGLTSYAAKYLLSFGNLELEAGELDVAIALLEQGRRRGAMRAVPGSAGPCS